MKFYFEGAFYDPEINPEIPKGALELTDEEHRVLLEAQSSGKVIAPDESGRPIAVYPPPPPLDERKAKAVAELWGNYKDHQQQYVDAEDLTLAVVCASRGSEKGAAVQVWVMNLWANYYQVKDAVEAAADVNTLDAIDLAPNPENVPPYTIRELNEEAATWLESQNNKEK